MEWGTKQAIENFGYIPDIVYDHGDIGKEPIIRIIGKNPNDVMSKLIKIIKYKI
jgi:hydroxymethylpyrimidine/phosphomethylpyrimidine kinase